ncbi:MAG: hypothetical protein NVSMB17_17650 [Candidatus Dormibacteria bacterium]
MDLMAALKASVEASKRSGRAAPAEEAQPSRAQAAPPSRPRVVKGKKPAGAEAAEKPRRKVAKAS